jgi:hypothetical protein
MMDGYKSYRLQMQECAKKGQQFKVSCVMCGQVNLICHKYKAYCNSGLCIDERMDDATKAKFYAQRVKDLKCKNKKTIS